MDFSKLAQLYSGFFEDYVREIAPERSVETTEEMTSEYDYGEEKKDDEGHASTVETKRNITKAREHVRTEPFLDLSLPVSEGTG